MTLKRRDEADHSMYALAKFELVHRRCEEFNHRTRAQSDKWEINTAGEGRKYQRMLLIFIRCDSCKVNRLIPQFSCAIHQVYTPADTRFIFFAE